MMTINGDVLEIDSEPYGFCSKTIELEEVEDCCFQ